MKTVSALCIICLLLGIAFGGWLGKGAAILARQPMEVRNGCAYYDMDSGDFTWGPHPQVVSAIIQHDDPVLGIPLPGRKPR